MTDVHNAVKGVIFDNDGVLVDSEPIANSVLAELVTSYGVAMSREDSVRRFLGTTLAYVRRDLERRGVDVPADFEDTYHRRVFDRFESDLVAVDGVVELLDRLEAAGIPVCVASSGSHERIERTLRLVGLWDRLRATIYSADDVAHGKPEPDLFLHAAAQQGWDPSAIVVVEDSPAGVAAARAAAMAVVGYAAVTPAEHLSDASAVCTSMEAVYPAIVSLNLVGKRA